MARPIAPRLLGIDLRADLDRCPRMLLAFPGAPARWVSVRILGAERERTKRWARVLGAQQLAAFTRAELQAMFDVARDGPDRRGLVGIALTNAMRTLEGDPLEAWEPAGGSLGR
jgi:hypothetical protein